MPNYSVSPEEVLPFIGGEHFEDMIDGWMKLEPQMLEREEPKILKNFNFPNTYTLTKNLAECMFKKHRGNMRISISRPAAVSATDRHPFPGWSDSIAAGGAVIYTIGMGLAHRDLSYPYVTNTFVPCDFVVNTILIAAAHSASLPTPQFTLFGCSPAGIKEKENDLQYKFFIDVHKYIEY